MGQNDLKVNAVVIVAMCFAAASLVAQGGMKLNGDRPFWRPVKQGVSDRIGLGAAVLTCPCADSSLKKSLGFFSGVLCHFGKIRVKLISPCKYAGQINVPVFS